MRRGRPDDAFGSNASRRLSPRKLKASTTSRWPGPGKIPIHQLSKCSAPVETIDPHSAAGGRAPRPRNDKRAEEQDCVAHFERREDDDWSGDVRQDVDHQRAVGGRGPSSRPVRDAFRLHGRPHQARTTRAWPGQETTTTASTAWKRPGPSAATTAIARRIVGIAKTKSAARITSSSTQPPR